MDELVKDEVPSAIEGSLPREAKSLAGSVVRFAFLFLAAAYGVVWVWHPILRDADPGFRFLLPALSYLFPALLFLLAITIFHAERWPSHRGARRNAAPLFALAVVLYLPMLWDVLAHEFQEGSVLYGLLVGARALVSCCYLFLLLTLSYRC